MDIRVLADALSPGEQAHKRLLDKERRSVRKSWPSRASAPALQRSLSSAPVFEADFEHPTEGPEELAWFDNAVIWSRGSQVIRTFSFDRQGEDVEKAAFVWFPAVSSAPESSGSRRESSSAATYKGKSTAAPSTLASPFGPFASSHQSQWGGPRGVTANYDGSISRPARAELERALVIFFKTHAIIYLPSGETITTHLPFQVDGVWPLAEGGVILQRALERREKKRWARRRRGENFLDGLDPDRTSGSVLDELVDLDDEVDSLPRLYTLSTPRGEARPVAQTPNYQGGYLSSLIKLTSPTRTLSPEMSIILVSSKPWPLLVAVNHEAREIVFFRWARIPSATTQSQPTAARSPTLSPLQAMQELPPTLPPKASSRPSMSRKRSSLGPSLGTDRRSSALGVGSADPLDRSNRRSSIQRQPRHSGIPENRSTAKEILHATLEPEDPFKAAAGRPVRSKRGPRGLSSGSILETDRRASVGRLDLNKSMNRMALNAAEEADLRETTMMFGLERDDEGLASEIVTEWIWAWPLTGQMDVDPSELQAFLSDTRSPFHALVHIHHTPRDCSPAILRTFKLKLDSEATAYSVELVEAVECLSAIPIISTRAQISDILMLSTAGDLQLLTSDCRTIAVAPPGGRRIIQLSDPVGSTFTAAFDDGSRSRCAVDGRLKDKLSLACFEILSLFIQPQDFFNLKVELMSRKATSWTAFEEVLQAVLGLSLDFQAPVHPLDRLANQSSSSVDPLRRRLAFLRPNSGTAMTRSRTLLECEQFSQSTRAACLLALHLLAEDCRLDSVRETQLSQLIPLIARLANALRRPEWTDHWMRLYPLSVAGVAPVLYDLERDPIPLLDSFDAPPDIYTYLQRRITGKEAAYPLPADLLQSSRPLGQWQELGEVRPLRLTSLVINVYNALCPDTNLPLQPAVIRASQAVLLMVASGLDEKWVDNLAIAVAIPIREAMKICQGSPPRDWPVDAYRFVGRSDQAIQSLALAGDEFQRNVETIGGTKQDIATLICNVHAKKNQEGKGQPNAEPVALPDIRFGADKRLKEVASMLQSGSMRTIAAVEPTHADDAELHSFRVNVANAIAHRTMAVAVGRAMFTYATKNAVITDAWVVPSIDLSIKISPSNAVVKSTSSVESTEWPNFHNGVASALSISPNSTGVDSSWIVFNKPAVLDASHGGFLLGLGLSGHLRCMQTWHAYPYLEPRHDPTTIGLLLGLASSFAGSQDSMITKVISLHTQALLPLGSLELSASPCIQSSALVALGLLHVGSRSYRMADAVLKEVGRRYMSGVENFTEHQEVYSFSASMAFGLIMLGQGGQTSSHVEKGMIGQLRRCILGDSDAVAVGRAQLPVERIDTTYSAPGATLALGLMFLKTSRRDITDILVIPQTTFDLDHIRPDLLLVRTLSRALIQWDEIAPSMAWIDAQLPACLRHIHKDHKKVASMGLPNELAYFNVIAGACFAVGLKYAGTATEFAHTTLMFFFGVFGKATANNTMSYEGKIRRTAARQGLNLITIALAMVMSGTGELNVLRRLRVSHGQEGAGVNYGTHMAMHMACGILFLGHGRHTLGSSNVAIAAMCIACFPRFSPSPSDNKAYLQAYRHLWALAVEPRCLIARDVDTHDTIYLPVKVRVMEGQKAKSQHLIAPTLVAPFERLVSIEVDSPRYWPVTYDVLNNHRDRQNLIRTGTIFVKRKAAFLDYNNDPKGNRSIFVRAGTMSGSDLFYDLISPAAPSAVSDEDFLALTSLHSGEPLIKTLGQVICRGQGSTFVQFAKFALLECISLDKWPVFFHYITAFTILRGISTYRSRPAPDKKWTAAGAGASPALLGQLRVLQTYYSAAVFDRLYAQASTTIDKRTTLFRPVFMFALVQELSATTTVHGLGEPRYYKNLQTPPSMLLSDLLDMVISLAGGNVPRLALLANLRQACSRMFAVYNEAAVQHEEAFLLILDKMRDTARRYDDLQGGPHGGKEVIKAVKPRIAIDNTPREWKRVCAEEALLAWIKDSDDE